MEKSRISAGQGLVIDLYHNILWSKYKAGVFSALFSKCNAKGLLDFRFYQIAETEGQRVGMGHVDVSYHNYPYQLLFTGSYDNLSVTRLITKLFIQTFKTDADLVLLPGYYRPEHWAMLLACVLRRKKRIVFSDSTLYDKPSRFTVSLAKRIFLLFCDAAFTYGERGKEHLIAHGMSPDRILIRHQAAALPSSYILETAVTNRERHAAKPNVPRFLFVGRLSKDKSIDVLLQAFAATLKNHPQASLIIVGRGPEEGPLKKMASNLGVSEHVEFCGGMELEALATEYQKATCLVLPSRKEPWGLVANEALHYGCPVIVSYSCGCVPELFEDGSLGIVFDTDNVSALAHAMIDAPIRFRDVTSVAKSCLEKISLFTPKIAAKQMHDGCIKLLGKG